MSSRKRNQVIKEFIEMCRLEPCLWQVKSKEYHDREKRDAAYERIVIKLKELEPDATKQSVVKKINNLRSNVRKEKKKRYMSMNSGASTDNIYTSELWYLHLFDFLGDRDTPGASVSELDDEDGCEIDEENLQSVNPHRAYQKMSQDNPGFTDQQAHENGLSTSGPVTYPDRGKQSVVSFTGGDRDGLNGDDDEAKPGSDHPPRYSRVMHKISAYSIEYDPYLRRDIQKPISYLAALVHLFKGSIGTGIMAVPNAFMHSGYVLGVVGTFAVGALCTYTMHLLVRASYELSRRRREPHLTYQETAVAALEDGPRWLRPVAPYAGHIVNVFMLILQLGSCCVYVVFISTNIKAVVDEYYSGLDLRIYMLILLVPLILINMVRNLKYLAPFTTLASLLTVAGFGITFYYLVSGSPTLDDKVPFGKIEEFPLFLGTVLFSLEAVGVILPLENSMKSPKKFGGPFGVLNVAMVLVVALFAVTGFLGYMKYGDQAEGSITLSLPKDEILAQSVKIMLAVAIFISHSLQNYVNIEIVWNGYLLEKLEKHRYKILFEYLVRILLVTVSFALAVAIPNLELFISLFGALCLSATGIAFPAIIYCFSVWNKETTQFKFVLLILRTGFIVLFGVVGLVVGTYISLSNIIIEFS